MAYDAHSTYLEGRVMAADPVELVGMLYQASIRSVSEARRHLASGEIRERSHAISRAQAMLLELAASLDPRGEELSLRLAGLYQYMVGRLFEANVQQQDAPLAEVMGLLTTLAEGWEGVGAELRAARPDDRIQPCVYAAGAEETPVHAWSF